MVHSYLGRSDLVRVDQCCGRPLSLCALLFMSSSDSVSPSLETLFGIPGARLCESRVLVLFCETSRAPPWRGHSASQQKLCAHLRIYARGALGALQTLSRDRGLETLSAKVSRDVTRASGGGSWRARLSRLAFSWRNIVSRLFEKRGLGSLMLLEAFVAARVSRRRVQGTDCQEFRCEFCSESLS